MAKDERLKRVTMNIDDELLKQADAFAASKPRTTRTDVFHLAVEEYLAKHAPKSTQKHSK